MHHAGQVGWGRPGSRKKQEDVHIVHLLRLGGSVGAGQAAGGSEGLDSVKMGQTENLKDGG